MVRPSQEEIETFVSITGASPAVARRKLEEHNGDLNGAVNAYFSEGDQSALAASAPVFNNDLMNIDEPIDVESDDPVPPLLSTAGILNPFALLDPTLCRNFLDERGSYGVSGSVPHVAHPKEVREIPIEVKGGSSEPGLVIEDVTGSASTHGPEIRGTILIDDDDDEALPVSPPERDNNGFTDGRRPGPSLMDYNDDIEEEMIKAAIEASKRDAEYPKQEFLVPDAAERERTPREHGVDIGGQSSHSSLMQLDVEKVAEEDGRQGFVSSNTETSSLIQVAEGNPHTQEEVEDAEEEPLVRRRSRRIASRNAEPTEYEPVVDSPLSSPQHHESSSHPQHNGDAFQGDEWGGISSEEHDEAVMLEAAMFGGLPEGTGFPFSYPTQVLHPGSETNSSIYPRLPRPPSPTLTAQRLLREQQDDEYLAALQADREKELKAKQEAEAAVERERYHEEEIRRKLLEEAEFERTLAEKEASLPQEPSAEDENAVTLFVRMPDGSRRGRRFLRSDMLKLLFDYIDVGRVVKPGTYRLVRPYPRRAFTSEEHESTLSELGLTSKQEALYMELI